MQTLDIRTIPHFQRHALIFQTFDNLAANDAIELVNDHDPRPLKGQFEMRNLGQFSWEYLEQGPTVWRVKIGKTK